MTVLVELLDRWQAIKRETMDGTEPPDQLICDGGYLAAAAGLDEAELAAIQQVVEPQLGQLIGQAIIGADPRPYLMTPAQAQAIAETAAAYYIEAIMFGHWAARQD